MKGKEARVFRLHRAAAALSIAAVAGIATVYAHGAGRYPGDANTDAQIDISDAVLIARYIAEDPDALMSRTGAANADANGDSVIDTDDILLILRQIAGYVPMPTPEEPGDSSETAVPAETTGSADPAATTESTVSETAVSETAVTESFTQTAETTATSVVQPERLTLTVDQTAYPLDISVSVLTGLTQPDEMLTVSYDIGNITFAIFAGDPAKTTIAIAYQDNIVGYYRLCRAYTAPEGYHAIEYRDLGDLPEEARSQPGAGELYAVFVLRDDISIDFPYLAEQNDFLVLSKLNYYGVNGIRASRGLKTLAWNDQLARLAVDHSADMADNNFFDHVGSDGSLSKERILNAGLDYSSCGENIDYGYRNTFSALNGWFNSSAHRSNLLSEKYTYIGVGFAYNENSDHQYYGTQDYCALF